VLWLRGKPHSHTAIYRGCVKWKEAKATLAKQAPDRGRKSPPYRSERKSGGTHCRADGHGQVVESRRSRKACCQGHYPINPYSKSPFSAGNRSFRKAQSDLHNEDGRPQKSEPKTTAAPKLAVGKSKKKAEASVKTAADKPTTPNLVVPNRSSTSPLEEISVLDHLPLHACVEQNRRLLTFFSSLPIGAARPRDLLDIVIFFVAKSGSTP